MLLAALSGCAGAPVGKSLEQSLAPDPKLQDNPVTLGAASPERQPNPVAEVQLPPDFPAEIPRYPNAQLVEVTQPTPPTAEPGDAAAATPLQTRWVTTDPINLVQNFYQQELPANNWEVSQPDDQPAGTLTARRDDLQLTIALQPQATANAAQGNAPPPEPAGETEFTIQYLRGTDAAEPPNAEATAPPPAVATATPTFSDLDNTSPELRQYIQDLAALGVLPAAEAGAKGEATTAIQFEPGKTISHREFARWLLAANNQIYASRPSQQIRPAAPTAQPAFTDVPPTDPDFPVIQGLAEAGLIPSPLSGDTTNVLFRPDAPLTREQLLLWKVPLDTRQALPNATVDAVKQTWGFQDVSRIEPRALRAVLADFSNGDQSNIRRAFGYTTLFQPKKPVTRAEAAAALWFFGSGSEGMSAQEALRVEQQQNQPQPAAPEPAP